MPVRGVTRRIVSAVAGGASVVASKNASTVALSHEENKCLVEFWSAAVDKD
jgi:hypothetical protein